MRYKVIQSVSENELRNMTCEKILPDYKISPDEEDINWVRSHDVLDASCEFVYDNYYNDFINEKILTKNLFYKLVREIHDVECKVVRLSNETIKNIFVSKSRQL